MPKKISEYNDSDWERFDQSEIIKANKPINITLWVLMGIAVLCLLAAFQANSDMSQKALDTCNHTEVSFDVCWKSINP